MSKDIDTISVRVPTFHRVGGLVVTKALGEVGFVVRHAKSGLGFSATVTTDEELAIRFADAIAPLADWSGQRASRLRKQKGLDEKVWAVVRAIKGAAP